VWVTNVAILATMVVAGVMVLVTIIPVGPVAEEVADLTAMSRLAQGFFAIALLVMATNLYKRKRMAWSVTVVVLTASLATHLWHAIHSGHLWGGVPTALTVVKVIILAILLWTAADFCCPSDRRSVRYGAGFGAIALLAVLANTGLAYHQFRASQAGRGTSLAQSFRLALVNLVGWPVNPGAPHLAPRFEMLAFWLTWIAVLGALVLILRPWVFSGKPTAAQRRQVRQLLAAHGHNVASYLTLEDDKTLFFSKEVSGVVAYGSVGSTHVVAGDPICAPADLPTLLNEFDRFAARTAHHVFYLYIASEFLSHYQERGYGTVKCGEEARFDLAEYSLAGKKGARMRSQIHRAANAGLTTAEYRPKEAHNPAIEAAFDRITTEWMEGKNTSELQFSVGGVGLDNPMDRRYFYAADADGTIQGFVVFVPFIDDGGRGWMADVTRRTSHAPGGITEKIIYDAFQQFLAEGDRWGSMGTAPLANVMEPSGRGSLLARAMTYVYENFSAIYGFKELHHAKEQYNPTEWRPVYFAYLPAPPTPQMLYAVASIQDSGGVWDYLRAFVRSLHRGQGQRAE
jgi:phosphatidylglycerol lysyltransferase